MQFIVPTWLGMLKSARGMYIDIAITGLVGDLNAVLAFRDNNYFG